MSNEELLKEAERRYPIGTMFKSFDKTQKGKDIIRIVKDYDSENPVGYYIGSIRDNFYIHSGMYPFCIKGKDVCSNPTVYENGIWAEIVDKYEYVHIHIHQDLKDKQVYQDLKDKLDIAINFQYSIKKEAFLIVINNKTFKKIFGSPNIMEHYLEYRGLPIFRTNDIDEDEFEVS